MFNLGFFGKKAADEDTTEQNIGNIASGISKDILKTLSGGEVKYTKKIIDNVVLLAGAAGGVGTSTLVSNIAYLASQRNFTVLVIDLNILYPVHYMYFGKNNEEFEKPDLCGFLLGKVSFGEAVETNGLVSLLYAHNRGISDIFDCESDLAIKNFTQGLDRARQLFDLILIDAPLDFTNEVVNQAFYMCDSIYFVWDEGISSIINTERIRRNLDGFGVSAYTKMRAILNKRTSIHYTKYPFEKLNTELAEVLPFDIAIIESSLNSEVFCEKGASSSKNANIFYHRMVELTDKIIVNGGYVNGQKKTA